MIHRVVVGVVAGSMLACSGGLFPPDVAFLDSGAREVDCPGDATPDVTCLVVGGEVTSALGAEDRTATGTCVVWATSADGENQVEVARMDVTMVPGEVVDVQVQVEVPAGMAADGWNAMCNPTIEG